MVRDHRPFASTRSSFMVEEVDGRTELWSAIAAVGAATYVAVLLVLPFLEPDFDVLRAHPEDYASGAIGLAVNVSYAALAVALVAFVMSVLPVKRWTIAVAALFLPPAVLCAALAVDPIGVAGGNPVWLLPVFCLALAPLIATLLLHDSLRRRRGALLAIAAAGLLTFAGVLTMPDAIGGIVNRAFDVSVGLWVLVASRARLPIELKLKRRIS